MSFLFTNSFLFLFPPCPQTFGNKVLKHVQRLIPITVAMASVSELNSSIITAFR